MRLPRFQVYTNLQSSGNSTGWMSGQTSPMPPTIREAVEVRAISQARYGRDADEVEYDYLAALGYGDMRELRNQAAMLGDGQTKGDNHAIGRKRKCD
jgi:hypothetical protein